MKKYEYNHVRMSYDLRSLFSSAAFDRQLSELLERMGNEGWELKSSFCEGLLPGHIHFVFGREVDAG